MHVAKGWQLCRPNLHSSTSGQDGYDQMASCSSSSKCSSSISISMGRGGAEVCGSGLGDINDLIVKRRVHTATLTVSLQKPAYLNKVTSAYSFLYLIPAVSR